MSVLYAASGGRTVRIAQQADGTYVVTCPTHQTWYRISSLANLTACYRCTHDAQSVPRVTSAA